MSDTHIRAPSVHQRPFTLSRCPSSSQILLDISPQQGPHPSHPDKPQSTHHLHTSSPTSSRQPRPLTRLVTSPEGLQAFFNNAYAIRAAFWEPTFSWYYINALLTFTQQHPQLPLGIRTLENQEDDIISNRRRSQPLSIGGEMDIPSPVPL